jgi:hypothetical protein
MRSVEDAERERHREVRKRGSGCIEANEPEKKVSSLSRSSFSAITEILS